MSKTTHEIAVKLASRIMNEEIANRQSLINVIEPSITDAATRMRDRCVEKVRDAIHDLSRTAIAAEQNAREIDALIKLREELKSLTLEGEQEEQEKL